MSENTETVQVALDRKTKNYAVYESENPLDGMQQVPSMHLALERFNGEPPEFLSVDTEPFHPN